MKQAIILFSTLFVAKKVSEQISKLRSLKLQIILVVLLRGAIVLLSLFLEMKLMFWVSAIILAVEIIGINLILKEKRSKDKETEMADEVDGVVYTLKENEYKVID